MQEQYFESFLVWEQEIVKRLSKYFGEGGNFIPLSGTVVGSPITGDLEFYYDFSGNPLSLIQQSITADDDFKSTIGFSGGPAFPIMKFSNYSESTYSNIFVNNSGASIDSNSLGFPGLIYSSDFSANFINSSLPNRLYNDQRYPSLTGNANNPFSGDLYFGNSNYPANTIFFYDESAGDWSSYISSNSGGEVSIKGNQGLYLEGGNGQIISNVSTGFTINGIIEYPNNATAIANGFPINSIYHTTVAGEKILKLSY